MVAIDGEGCTPQYVLDKMKAIKNEVKLQRQEESQFLLDEEV